MSWERIQGLGGWNWVLGDNWKAGAAPTSSPVRNHGLLITCKLRHRQVIMRRQFTHLGGKNSSYSTHCICVCVPMEVWLALSSCLDSSLVLVSGVPGFKAMTVAIFVVLPLPLPLLTFLTAFWFCSVAQSCSTLLRPHGLQLARLPCPSLSPRAFYLLSNPFKIPGWMVGLMQLRPLSGAEKGCWGLSSTRTFTPGLCQSLPQPWVSCRLVRGDLRSLWYCLPRVPCSGASAKTPPPCWPSTCKYVSRAVHAFQFFTLGPLPR